KLDTVRADVGRQRHLILSVETDPIVVNEIGILSRLLARGREPHRAGGLIDVRDLRDRAVAIGDPVLDLSGLQVVQEDLREVLPLGIPEDLVRRPENLPGYPDLEV